MLTGISEVTYTNSNTSTASTYSVGDDAHIVPSNSLAQSLLGGNYREVDLTANALINVGDEDLDVPNMNTYSTNTTTSTNTLYTFQCDGIGNLTSVGNAVNLNWNGRRLESISQNGTEVLSYKYNIDGQRVSKTYNGETTEYFYNGDILAGQKRGNDVLVFMYDNNGDVFGFTYNGTPYYYVKNAQNDVFLILDETGMIQVLYQYDSWGKVTFCADATDFGLAGINPIMYRSYYVDLEMGMFMYYLNSRYYMADWGRFISADSYVQTGQGMLDKNMFAYCGNNPVNYVDPTGTMEIGTMLLLVVTVGGLLFLNWLVGAASTKTEADAPTLGDTVVTIIEEEIPVVDAIDKGIGIGRGRDKALNTRSEHAKNAVNANYAKQNNLNFSALNIDETIFSSNAEYSNYCLSRTDTLLTVMDGCNVNIRGKTWDDLSDYEQRLVEDYAILWDEWGTYDIGKNTGTVTAFGFAL